MTVQVMVPSPDGPCRPVSVGAGTGFFLLQQIRNGDLEAIQDSHGQCLVERGDNRHSILLIPVDGGSFFGRIHDPVFPDADVTVECILGGVVHPAG